MKFLIINGEDYHREFIRRKFPEVKILDYSSIDFVKILKEGDIPADLSAFIVVSGTGAPNEEYQKAPIKDINSLVSADISEEVADLLQKNPNLLVVNVSAETDVPYAQSATPEHKLFTDLQTAIDNAERKIAAVNTYANACSWLASEDAKGKIKDGLMHIMFPTDASRARMRNIGKFHGPNVVENRGDKIVHKVSAAGIDWLKKEALRLSKIHNFNAMLRKTGDIGEDEVYVRVPGIDSSYFPKTSSDSDSAPEGYNVLNTELIEGGEKFLTRMSRLNLKLDRAVKEERMSHLEDKMNEVEQVVRAVVRAQVTSLYLPTFAFEDVHGQPDHYVDMTKTKFLGDISVGVTKRNGWALVFDSSEDKKFRKFKKRVLELSQPIFDIISNARAGRYTDRSPTNILVAGRKRNLEVFNVDHDIYRNYPMEFEFGQVFNPGKILSNTLDVEMAKEIVFNGKVLCSAGHKISEKRYTMFTHASYFNEELESVVAHAEKHGIISGLGAQRIDAPLIYRIRDFDDHAKIVLAGGVFRAYSHFSASVKFGSKVTPAHWSIAYDTLSAAIDDIEALEANYIDNERDRKKLRDLSTLLRDTQKEYRPVFEERANAA
jgi:hypothetical protein